MSFSAGYFATHCGATDRDWQDVLGRRRAHYGALLRQVKALTPAAHDIVDVGCGLGFMAHSLAEVFGPRAQILAGDISEHAVAIAGDRLRGFPWVSVRILDAEDLCLEHNSQDIMTAMDIIEHLENPERFLRHASRILRPRGLLLLSTPNPRSLGARLKAAGPMGGTDKRIWFAWRDATHVNVRPIGSWRALCVASGFEKVRDGTDFWWDTPYFSVVPRLTQKLVFNGSHRLLAAIFGFLPWEWGENYIGIWRKT